MKSNSIQVLIIAMLCLVAVIAIMVKTTATAAPIAQLLAQEKQNTNSVWLGVQVLPIDKTIAQDFNLPYPYGLLIQRVINGSPADEAGLKKGDVIRRVNSVRLLNTQQLQDLMNKKVPGDKIRVVFGRQGIDGTVYVQLESRPIGLANPNSMFIANTYPASAPPTNKPYPYFYFGETPDAEEGFER